MTLAKHCPVCNSSRMKKSSALSTDILNIINLKCLKCGYILKKVVRHENEV